MTIEKKLLKDDYLIMSYKRYMQLKKQNNIKNEKTATGILEAHRLLKKHFPMDSGRITTFVKKLIALNNQYLHIVYPPSLQYLYEFSMEEPDIVAEVMNYLYDEMESLRDRIELFRQRAKEFDDEFTLSAPFFGFMLAIFNPFQYPLYRGKVYENIKEMYSIVGKEHSVVYNYEHFKQICSVVLTHIQKNYKQATMLDVQQYLFFLNDSNQLQVETAIIYLHRFAKKVKKFITDPELLIRSIQRMDDNLVEKLKTYDRNDPAINRMHRLLLNTLFSEATISFEDVEQMVEKEGYKHATHIDADFNVLSLLFQIYYINYEKRVENLLRNIHAAFRQIPEFETVELHDDNTIEGFGSEGLLRMDQCRIVIYKTDNENASASLQFIVDISADQIKYGALYGTSPSNFGEEDLISLTEARKLNYEELYNEFVRIAWERKWIPTDLESIQKEELFTVEEWKELLQNNKVFYPRDLQYLQYLFRFGGQASYLRIAQLLQVNSRLISQNLLNLSKRIVKHSHKDLSLDDLPDDSYKFLFFDHRYVHTGHLQFSMKPNFYEAFEQVYAKACLNTPIYTKDDFLQEVFIDPELYGTITDLLAYKQNIILQGPPGVGKTFVASRLAYSLIGAWDSSKVEIVQFHQNYAYEDFVMGFRPTEKGHFQLEYGVFYTFCERALERPEENFYFIIDEINRGNVSKVFGELFMLIEKSKRGDEITLSYSKERFTIPENVYIIGTMNTADKSLAQLDVALRRRFSFITLEPQFGEKWERHLRSIGVSNQIIQSIRHIIFHINKEIRQDYQLGRGFEIGHSYFTNKPDYLEEHTWLDHVIQYEIRPLLEEYYFDRPEKVDQLIDDV